MERRNLLWNARQEKGVLICAHQGAAAGNVPGNTLSAFEAALMQGADMLETDVTISKDGEMFIFHPGKEKVFLDRDIHLEEMTGTEIRQLRYVNSGRDITECPIMSLDEFLETFKNRCFINLDHGWKNLQPMVKAVRRHKMEEQILIKAPANLQYARIMEEIAPDIMFMPIIKEVDEISEHLERMNINFAGSELVFAKEDSLVARDEYIESQHNKGRFVWVNALLYSYRAQLSGGHSDDVAVAGNPESGWGWLLDKGFDIIQTDWSMPLRYFIDHRNKNA